ncbi:MAG: hypothetical protein NTX25_13955, partial [Proteobacteria bacterium]|nr:hypothetical protein [Pseudomonadota bacterium]
AFDSAGNLYAGGAFTTAGGIAANRIAKWNGTSWSSLGTGMNSSVRVIKITTTGDIYAGGDFTTVDGLTRPFVAFWSAAAGMWQ